MKSRLPAISIIGAGAVGSALAYALHEHGYPVASVISRTGRKAIRLARAVECRKASGSLADIDRSTEVLLLTVSDDAIGPVAAEVAKVGRLKFSRLLAVHCSGVHPASLLRPLARKGADIASLHPIQTFPAGQSPASLRSKLRGGYCGIEGDEASLKRVLPLVRAIKGVPLTIPRELKPLYHVACVFASNYLTVLLNAISELSEALALKAPWAEVFGPLMAASMELAVREPSGVVLTGPIVRKDLHTIELHLNALARYAPQLLPLYTVSGIDSARIARAHGRLSQEDVTLLVRQFRSFITAKGHK